jgi:hypothetical protein
MVKIIIPAILESGKVVFAIGKYHQLREIVKAFPISARVYHQ